MDIQQLRFFNAVVHLENISRAADSLHISQSALSKQIKALEEELGVPLFDRRGKKIVLNKAGLRFYRSSEQILRELQAAGDDLRSLIARSNPRIRIGSAFMPPEMLLCIADFSKQHPKAQFVLRTRIEYEEHIDINQYDALICPEEVRFEHLSGHHLCSESYFFAVPSAWPAAKEPVFSVEILKDAPLVFLQGTDLTPEYPFRLCTPEELESATLFLTDSASVHYWMIAEGQACGFVPGTQAGRYRNDPRIRLLPVLDARFTRPLKICFLRERHLSDLGLLFRDHVISWFHLE